ncbi:MAG TPA: hypothetical protein VKR59_13375 [Terriglobales bacterium]|nr:hypothetical protein [Terriglobales bacterium]
MSANSPDRSLDPQLSELEACRYLFGKQQAARVVQLLAPLDAKQFPDPPSLIRFHETLLFLRAFPQGPAVVRATGRVLNAFHKRVAALRNAGVDMDAFDTFETSGIAGTEMEDTLSFDVARWLIKRMPGKVEIAWGNYEDSYEPGRELGTTGPRFMPLLEDDAFVEADTPWQDWIEAAASKKKAKKKAAPEWLIQRFEQLALPPQQKSELYESLRIPLRWKLENSPLTRTRNIRPVRQIFYHSEPLISRSQVSLASELAKRPPKLTRLSPKQGAQVMDLIREVMLVRYRELYGTTLGDPRSVVRADLGGYKAGRGVTIYLWNLPPDRRLPLRAYVAGLTLKNGVPINYIESIGLCEWMEVGFNTFYTFRGGEAGWIYAQVLRCLCHLMGTTCISVYPYQLGKDNDEAIESGAFWFYRKLGFRPGHADLQELAEREEKKIAANPKYRTAARTLKRLSAEHVFYELPGSEVGAWDRFSTRNIGLRVNRRMARDFGGDAERMREYSKRTLERALGVNTSSWSQLEKAAFDNYALVLGQVPELDAWNKEDKEGLVRVIRAKASRDEMLYLHLTQQHDRLRSALLRLGRSQ